MGEPTPVAFKYLAERGIKLETVTAHRVELYRRPLTAVWRTWLGFEYWGHQPLESLVEEAILFPCADPGGMIRARIVRPFPQLGEDTKFLAPKGGDGYPFVPPATWAAKDKAHRPIFVTEGPCKALAILQAGGLPIGVGGVWMATVKDGLEATALHPVLAQQFLWRGRRVFLVFDADIISNPSVRQALIRTLVLFHKAGADTAVLRWPLINGKGIDDFLVSQSIGEISPQELLTKLCAEAASLSEILKPLDLEVIELEFVRAQLQGARLKQLCRSNSPVFASGLTGVVVAFDARELAFGSLVQTIKAPALVVHVPDLTLRALAFATGDTTLSEILGQPDPWGIAYQRIHEVSGPPTDAQRAEARELTLGHIFGTGLGSANEWFGRLYLPNTMERYEPWLKSLSDWRTWCGQIDQASCDFQMRSRIPVRHPNPKRAREQKQRLLRENGLAAGRIVALGISEPPLATRAANDMLVVSVIGPR